MTLSQMGLVFLCSWLEAAAPASVPVPALAALAATLEAMGALRLFEEWGVDVQRTQAEAPIDVLALNPPTTPATPFASFKPLQVTSQLDGSTFSRHKAAKRTIIDVLFSFRGTV